MSKFNYNYKSEMSNYTGPGDFIGTWGGRIGGAVAGESVAGTPGGIVGGHVGGKVGSAAGQAMDRYCESEGKKIASEYDAAIKSGMSQEQATRYALTVTGWEDYSSPY